MRYNRRVYKRLIIPAKEVRVGDYLVSGKRHKERVSLIEIADGEYHFDIEVETSGLGYGEYHKEDSEMHVWRYSLKDLLNEI